MILAMLSLPVSVVCCICPRGLYGSRYFVWNSTGTQVLSVEALNTGELDALIDSLIVIKPLMVLNS